MQYIDRVKKENKMISLKEFKEQLDLMKKHYGAEEELYPYIYLLLREAGFTQQYSVRSVAGARSDKDDKDNNKFDYKELYEFMLAVRAHGWTRNLPADSTIYQKKEDHL